MHLDRVGAQVRWVTGPWFLTVYVNVVPWDSVLRLWDILCLEGHRAILFATALSLIHLHGTLSIHPSTLCCTALYCTVL